MAKKKVDNLQGSLDLLILKTLERAPNHGFGITAHVSAASEGLLEIEEGSLYPALQRMRLKGWVNSEWRLTPTHRRARYYRLTALGRKQLGIEHSTFARMVEAIGRVMQEG